MTPSALALDSRSEAALRRLLGRQCRGRGRRLARCGAAVLGFIPTGWYPTAVRSLAGRPPGGAERPRAAQLPEPEGPDPPRQGRAVVHQRHGGRASTSAKIQTGTLSVIDPFDDEAARPRTRRRCSPTRPIATTARRVPATRQAARSRRPGDPSPSSTSSTSSRRTAPTTRCSATSARATATRRWRCSAKTSAPNHHKLAREFVLLDNFYVNADVSADGHNWSTAAIAPTTCRRCGPTATPAGASTTITKAANRPRCRRPAISGPTPLGPDHACGTTDTWCDQRARAPDGRRRSSRVRDPVSPRSPT